EFQLDDDEKKSLLILARSSVETWVRTGKKVDTEELARKYPKLTAERACFVTLRVDGQLRGCIGSLEPRRPLVIDVADNAVSAAVRDTRFAPVAESELSTLRYEISVLDLPRVLEGVSAAELPSYMGKHKPGVIIEYRGRRSTFLPSVWDELPEPEGFLSRLCMKQGSPGDCWRRADVKISTYGSLHFEE
ncbi:MAG: AmmeMemoRadiSam system protein A, partial [Polyangiaceae bacterium]|nr:AmmeMemoRadiSam system protein A [Polyangiaceae bacterium]